MRYRSDAPPASGRRGFLAGLGGLGSALLFTRNARAQETQGTPAPGAQGTPASSAQAAPAWTPPPIPEPLPSSEGTPPALVGAAPPPEAPVSGAPTSIEQPSAAGTPGVGSGTPVTGGEMPVTNPQQPAQPLATPVSAESKVTPAVTVTITPQFTFDPAEVTIHVGEAVEWRNEGRSPQTVTDDPSLVNDDTLVSLPEGADPWDSNVLNHGATFIQVFTTPGEYRYVSLPQAANGMSGRVVVEP